MALQMEIQRLQPDMIAALPAPIGLPVITPLVLVVDLFTPNEPIQTSHGKKLRPDDDPDVVQF